jgi:hypothetical protein
MRPPKVTDAMRAEVRATVIARRAIPSNRDLAQKWGCCKGLIDTLSAQVSMDLALDDAPRGTTGVNLTSSHNVRG